MITFFLELYDTIYNYLTSVEASRVILALEIISWLVSFTMIFLIYILLKRSDATWWIRESVNSRKFAYSEPTDMRWVKIQDRLRRGDEVNLKLAVIEADNVMGELLKRMSLPGKDMAERLKQFEKHELRSIDLVWESHKLRNQIVHEPSFHITREEAERAVEGIGAALRELEYLH